MKPFLLALCGLSVLSVALVAEHAPQSSYRVVAVSGDVVVRHANAATAPWQAATAGLLLVPGDWLRTGADGIATLVMTDGTQVRVKSDTLFQVPPHTAPHLPTPPLLQQVALDRPPGVPQHLWFVLGTGVGLELSQPELRGRGSVEGTLWVRTGQSWSRVYLAAPAPDPRQVVPAK